jgi:Transposase DDE domain
VSGSSGASTPTRACTTTSAAPGATGSRPFRVHRTTFTRQAANLWAVKAQLRQQLLARVGFDPAVSILDSFSMPVCRFGRAYRCRRLAGLAAFGRDDGAKQTDYGLRARLRVCWPGVIADGLLAPANLHDLVLAEELLHGVGGWALGDRSYWSPSRAGMLAGQGVWLLAPSRSAKGSVPRLPGRLVQARRRIETVIGQLVERYHAKRVWARDAWHLWSRWQRKLV